MTLAPRLLQEEELEPLWILFPDDVDSWQKSLWRFIFPPQTSRINENKIQRLSLCGRRPSFFLDVFLNTQKTNGLRLLIFFGLAKVFTLYICEHLQFVSHRHRH